MEDWGSLGGVEGIEEEKKGYTAAMSKIDDATLSLHGSLEVRKGLIGIAAYLIRKSGGSTKTGAK